MASDQSSIPVMHGESRHRKKAATNYTAEVLHSIPGRMRISVPQLKYNQEALTGLQTSLSEQHGIDDVKVNSQRGTFVVSHKLQPDELRTLLALVGINPLISDVLTQTGAYHWLAAKWEEVDQVVAQKTGDRIHLSMLTMVALSGLGLYHFAKARTLADVLRRLR